MSSIFTDFLHRLDRRASPPDPETFDQLWKALRSVLAGEMKRRSVWSSPPSFLGVFGWGQWAERTTAADQEPTGEALEELLAECYSFIFVHRLRSLQAQLKLRRNVDGLIFLNVRHFLHDTQKRFDPLGFHVFEVVQNAIRKLLATGELHVIEGDVRVRNETILGFRRGCDPAEAESAQLAERVAGWNDELLPALVTARGKDLDLVCARLATRLGELPADGVQAFRFKDLIDPFKTDVRGRWAALFEQSGGDLAAGCGEDGDAELQNIVRRVQPDTSCEERDRFEKLVGRVETRLEQLEVDPATSAYLTCLWRFLCAHAAEWSENGSTDGGDGPAGDNLPSRRKLAELLRIPRDRLPGLYLQLGRLLEECRDFDARQPRALPLRTTSGQRGQWKEKQ